MKTCKTGSKRIIANYSPDQARDEHGRWADGGDTEEAGALAPTPRAPTPEDSLEDLHRAVLLHHNEVAMGIKNPAQLTKVEHLAHAKYHEQMAEKEREAAGHENVKSRMYSAAAHAHRVAAKYTNESGLKSKIKDVTKDTSWGVFGSVATDLGQKAIIAAGSAVGALLFARAAKGGGTTSSP